MCGIAGCITTEPLDTIAIKHTLALMSNRGPDHSHYLEFKFRNKYIYLLHSRLSIIDLDARSNQPFTVGDYNLIFNGEIYNYLELKKKLIQKGYTFITSSDTEILINAFIEYGDEVEKYLEGMWAFAIWNNKSKLLYISRDRFGEKPLYYMKSDELFYFGSEIKYIKSLSKKKLEINYETLKRYLVYGYRSIYKKNETYYKNVHQLKSGSFLKIDHQLQINQEKYWTLNNLEIKLSESEAVEGAKECLLGSLEKRLRSDVPIAFNLSGGIDSSTLVVLAKKYFNIEINSYSIIDDDPRYNESENINQTVRLTESNHTNINLKDKFSYEKLKKLINYHDQPLCTINFYAHALLQEKISEDGYKVSISGTGADEIFTGYYDHHLYFLHSIKDNNKYQNYLNSWNSKVKNIINNPLLRDPELFERKGEDFRGYLYSDSIYFQSMLIDANYSENFVDISYNNKSLLRNRMMNELFNEVVPILMENEDLNSMYYSIENRSPYLDTNLLQFVNSIPQEYLMDDGYAKKILRDITEGLLDDQVRLDRNKRGFNASIKSILDLSDKKTINELVSDSPIFDIVNKEKFINYLTTADFYSNENKKFLFSFINAKLFLENNL